MPFVRAMVRALPEEPTIFEPSLRQIQLVTTRSVQLQRVAPPKLADYADAVRCRDGEERRMMGLCDEVMKRVDWTQTSSRGMTV